jgi:hypothetical protein
MRKAHIEVAYRNPDKGVYATPEDLECDKTLDNEVSMYHQTGLKCQRVMLMHSQGLRMHLLRQRLVELTLRMRVICTGRFCNSKT